MAEQSVILNVEINRKDIEQANDAIRLSRQSIDELKLANQKLAEQGKKNSKEYISNTATLKALNQTVRENERVLVANEKAMMASEGSIEQLRAQLSNVSTQWAKLSKEERENEEIGGKLAKQKLDLTEKLKAEEKATGDTRRNVGNYSEGVQEAIEQSGLFGAQLGKLKQAQQAYQGASKLATRSTKAFRLALISTGIGAIVAAVGALVAAFASTQKGADAISKALAPVKAVFQGLIGIAQDLSTQLFDAFKNPKQAVTDLWEAIKKNIVNRITAVPKFFQGVIDTIVGYFKFLGASIKSIVADIPIIGKGIDKAAAKKNAREAADVLKQSLKDTGKALIQVNTGLDKEQRKSLVNFAKAQKERLSIAAKTGKRIAELNIEIEKTEIDLTTRRAELNREFERSKEISEDESKSEEERRAAAVAAIEAQDKLLTANQEFLDLQIEKKKLELSLNDSDREDKLELAKLEAERTQFEAEAAGKRVGARNFLEALDKEIAGKQEERLKKKIAAEQELADLATQREELRREEEKVKLAEERAEGLLTKQEYEQALLQIELDTLEMAKLAAEEAKQGALESTELTEAERQRIILESENVILAARKRTAELSIAAQKEVVETTGKIEDAKVEQSKVSSEDIISATQGVAKEGSVAAKAAGVAQATISTYTAAAKALEIAPPFGAILAALITAKGLLNVNKIVSTPTPSFASGGFTGDGYGTADSSGYKPAGIVHEGEYVIKKSMVDNPAFSGVISALETSRLRGYADGGFVSRAASTPASEGAQASQLQATLSDIKNIQPIVRVTDINRVSQQQQMVQVSGELS